MRNVHGYNTVIGPIIREMILKFEELKCKFGNSQQQFLVTDGECKEYISHTRHFEVKWLRRERQ